MGRDCYSSRPMIDNCLILSIKTVKEQFINAPDKTIRLEWGNGAKMELIYRKEPEKLEFNYSVNSTPVNYTVYIIRQDCNYGNYRYYFECPYCEKKIYKLYLPLSGSKGFGVWRYYFTCRDCHNLTYRKQKKHNKSDNKFRWNWYLMEADKLIEQNAHKTAKGIRKINRLREKSHKYFEKYGHILVMQMDKLKEKVEKIKI